MNFWQTSQADLKTRDGFVAEKLREAIQQGYFEPGQKLDQHEIAELLNVSRSPVREALRTLAAEGLVEFYPHRGAVVVELSWREVEEIFLMRAVLEGLAARLGVAHITDSHIAKLQATFERLNQITSYSDWLKFNGEFHHTIYQADERSHLLSLIQRLRNITAPYIRQYIASPEHLAAAQIGHQRILEACLNRDQAGIESETIKHIEAVGQDAIAFAQARAASNEDDA